MPTNNMVVGRTEFCTHFIGMLYSKNLTKGDPETNISISEFHLCFRVLYK